MFDIGTETFLVQHKTHMFRLNDYAKGVVQLVDGMRSEKEIAEQLPSQGTGEGEGPGHLHHVRDVLDRMRSYGLVGTYPDGR